MNPVRLTGENWNCRLEARQHVGPHGEIAAPVFDQNRLRCCRSYLDMKIAEFLFRRDTRAPMLALMFSSLACAALVGGRIAWTGNVRYTFLLWNLFLAWLPLFFALLATEFSRRAGRHDWRFAALAAAWLAFFPNAPYIFTDLIHLTRDFYRFFWVDLSLLLLCALTGFLLGFVSLYLMQAVVTRLFGRMLGWFFVAGVAALVGFGTTLGRFMRFNSWDVLTRPLTLSKSIGAWVANPASDPSGLSFAMFFAVFFFVAHVMLYALTQLPRPDQLAPGAKPTSAGKDGKPSAKECGGP